MQKRNVNTQNSNEESMMSGKPAAWQMTDFCVIDRLSTSSRQQLTAVSQSRAKSSTVTPSLKPKRKHLMPSTGIHRSLNDLLSMILIWVRSFLTSVMITWRWCSFYLRHHFAMCFTDFVGYFWSSVSYPSVLWHCWFRSVKIEWWGVGVLTCLERGADCLHMVQQMPLPSRTQLSLASFKSILVLPFWYWLTQVGLEKRTLNGCSSSRSSCGVQYAKVVSWWVSWTIIMWSVVKLRDFHSGAWISFTVRLTLVIAQSPQKAKAGPLSIS